MAALRRLVHLVWGDEIDAALRPVLAVSLAASLAGSSLWSFMAIWAVEELDAKAQLPFVFGVGAVLAGVSGFVGGHLSDRFGRRRIILLSQGLMVGYPLLLLAASGDKWTAIAMLMLAGALGSLGGSVSQAMVADLVAPERHEPAYAAVRVAANFGVIMGPPFGGLLLVVGGWSTLFVAVSCLSCIAWLLALRLLPRRGLYAPEGPPQRSSLGVIRRDLPFLLFLGSAVFAWLVYVAYEVVLPVSLVDGFGYGAATWGFLVWINPFLVTVFQLRLTRATLRVPAPTKLVVAMLTMGLPFLLLTRTHALVPVIVVVTVFVVGEMLWVPTSQAVIADLAPADVRGAYMGAFGSTAAVGFAIAPLVGFQVRNSFGDDTTWVMFAGISVVAAALGGLACAGLVRRARSAPPPAVAGA